MLRRRSYTETSLLLELLTSESRCVHAVYRGAKRPKATPIDLFAEYSMSWRAKSGLVTLRSCEVARAYTLVDDALYAGLYINELIRRGIRENQVIEGLIETYTHATAGLADAEGDLETTLRTFERDYLRCLGFAITFDQEQATGLAIEANASYRFLPDGGFRRTNPDAQDAHIGRVLLDISNDEYASEASRRVAKLVLREALEHHLGEREIKARSLLSAKHYRDAATGMAQHD